MNAKLTLRLDESLIAAAKDYAALHGSSVSQMVANYFAAVTQQTAGNVRAAQTNTQPAQAVPDDWESKLGPITRSLIGIAVPTDGSPVPTKEDYYRYLEDKHS